MTEDMNLKTMMINHVKSFIRVFDLMEGTVKLIKEDKESSPGNLGKIKEMYREYQEKDTKKIQKFKKRIKRMFSKHRSKSRKRKISMGEKKESLGNTEIGDESQLQEKGILNQTFEKMITDLEEFLKKSFVEVDEGEDDISMNERPSIQRENALDEDSYVKPSPLSSPEGKEVSADCSAEKEVRSDSQIPSKMLKKDKIPVINAGDEATQTLEKKDSELIIPEFEPPGEVLGMGNLAQVDIDESLTDHNSILESMNKEISPNTDYEPRMSHITHFNERLSHRANFKWALNKAVQTNDRGNLWGFTDDCGEEMKKIKKENIELRRSITKLLRFNFSVDKFKVDPIYDSGFGTLIEVYNRNAFLVKNPLGKTFFLKSNAIDDRIMAFELSYNDVPLLILKTLYVEDLDILFISDKEFLYKLKDGKISIEDELSKTSVNLLKKSEQGNTIIYLKNQKILKVLPIDKLLNQNDEDFELNRMNFRSTGSLRQSAISMIDPMDPLRASNMTGLGVDWEDSHLGKEYLSDTITINSNILDAFLPEENVVCVIDGAYFYKAYRIEKQTDEGSSDDFAQNLTQFGDRSKIRMIASQRIYTMNLKQQCSREFHYSKNHLTVVNHMNAIDLFKFTSEYKLEYLASLKHKFSPYSFVRAKMEIFGNPIITIFQKRNDGFHEVFNYLFFEQKFISIENKNRRLLFKDVNKVVSDNDKFVVISNKLEYYHRIKVNF